MSEKGTVEFLWFIIAGLFVLWLMGLLIVPMGVVLPHFLLLAAFLLLMLRLVRGERIF